MLEHVLMLESLHQACGCLLIPNFSAFLALPEHQSVVERCSTDEEITAGHYKAGNGLGTSRGVNVWPRKMIGNYEQHRTWDGSRIQLYLVAFSLVSVSSACVPCIPYRQQYKWVSGCPGGNLPPISSSSHSASRICQAQTLQRLQRLSALLLAILLACYKNIWQIHPSALFCGVRSPCRSSDTYSLKCWWMPKQK